MKNWVAGIVLEWEDWHKREHLKLWVNIFIVMLILVTENVETT